MLCIPNQIKQLFTRSLVTKLMHSFYILAKLCCKRNKSNGCWMVSLGIQCQQHHCQPRCPLLHNKDMRCKIFMSIVMVIPGPDPGGN